MRVVALISGGKDSCYAAILVERWGHQLVALANLHPTWGGMPEDHNNDDDNNSVYPSEEDLEKHESYMYQTAGHSLVAAYARCCGLPLFRRRIVGSSVQTGRNYHNAVEGDEVEDLHALLKAAKVRVGAEAVCSGAVASDYQRVRVENVCARLGLVSIAPLWRKPQGPLLQDMIDDGITAILVKVAAIGLEPDKHLGKDLLSMQPHLKKLASLYGCNECGEGGEYETLTLDCPLFKHARIVLDAWVVQHAAGGVGLLHPTNFHIEPKSEQSEPVETSIINVLNDNMTTTQDTQCAPTTSSQPEADVVCTLPQCGRYLHVSAKGRSTSVEVDIAGCLESINQQLATHRLSWADVLFVYLYVPDMSHFAAINQIYSQHVRVEDCPRGVPSRACVEIGPGSDIAVMVDLIVAKVDSDQRDSLHVQSISEWAPACIGPYSQATKHAGLLFLAGQLGLDPISLTPVQGGIAAEASTAFTHCESVAEVVGCSVRHRALSCTMFVAGACALEGADGASHAQAAFFEESEATWSPLCAWVKLPALPKGALVEVLPLVHAPPSPSTTTPSYDSDSDSDNTNSNHRSTLTWCRDDNVTADSTRHALYLHGELCIAHASVGRGEDNHAKSLVHNTVQQLTASLQKAALGWEDTLYMRVYYCEDATGTSSSELREAIKGAVERVSAGIELSAVVVPVLAVGSTSALDCVLFAEVVAVGEQRRQ